MATEKTVIGTGAAAAISRPGVRSGERGNGVEIAMSNEIQAIARESVAIAESEKDPAKRDALIAALNHPDNMRARMLRARDIAVGKIKA